MLEFSRSQNCCYGPFDLNTSFFARFHVGDGSSSIQSSSGQLYPALIPSAPSTETIRVNNGVKRSQGQAQNLVAESSQQRDAGGVTFDFLSDDVAANRDWGSRAAGSEVEAVRPMTTTTRTENTSEPTGEVVEDLLTENERLRVIIQDMSDEVRTKRGLFSHPSIEFTRVVESLELEGPVC